MQQAIEELEKALAHLVKTTEQLEREPSSTYAFTVGWNTIRATKLTRNSLKLLRQEKEE